MTTYVDISRQDIEDWLNTFPRFRGKWWLVEGRAGIYMLPLSNNVAIKFSSTVGTQDRGLSRGGASAQLRLVSLQTGQVLNKKAQGQRGFYRTINWKKNWKKGVDTFVQTYTKSADFYERIALAEDRGQTTPERGSPEPDPEKEAETQEKLNELRKLYLAAKRAGDRWTYEQFLDPRGNVVQRVKKGQPLSPKQKEILFDKFDRYADAMGKIRLGSTAAELAERYLQLRSSA